ncbi:hypothetical protein [Jeotgalibacillus malaysiensis]|uniref:hypothetical protein n=1 Tax=Jeotgalibacillus malaysiensis TaxID=1508404 RepID=UPI0038509093
MKKLINITETIFLGLFIFTTIPSLIFNEITWLSLIAMISLAGWITMSGFRLIEKGQKNGGKVIVSLGILLLFLSFFQ